MAVNDYNEEVFQSRLKCEENNLEMLKKTLSHMIEIGSNNTDKVEKLVKESQDCINFLRKCIETKTVPSGDTHIVSESISDFIRTRQEELSIEPDDSYPMLHVPDEFTSSLVRSNDFAVWFDGIDIDGKYVRRVHIDRSEKTIYIVLYSYCIPTEGKNGILEYVLNKSVGTRIGDITIQIPGKTNDKESGYNKKYKNCVLTSYAESPFSYDSCAPLEITLHIGYDELEVEPT